VVIGVDSILEEEFLSVARHKLSLNDIQQNFVFKKFGKKTNRNVCFYQGNIGSPNIRPEAYKGNKVYHQLVENAEEFVNSNRGTSIKRKNHLYVSKYYQQTKSLFKNFEGDLQEHLEKYAIPPMSSSIMSVWLNASNN
jgi:hypothetical protein